MPFLNIPENILGKIKSLPEAFKTIANPTNEKIKMFNILIFWLVTLLME